MHKSLSCWCIINLDYILLQVRLFNMIYFRTLSIHNHLVLSTLDNSHYVPPPHTLDPKCYTFIPFLTHFQNFRRILVIDLAQTKILCSFSKSLLRALCTICWVGTNHSFLLFFKVGTCLLYSFSLQVLMKLKVK